MEIKNKTSNENNFSWMTFRWLDHHFQICLTKSQSCGGSILYSKECVWKSRCKLLIYDLDRDLLQHYNVETREC